MTPSRLLTFTAAFLATSASLLAAPPAAASRPATTPATRPAANTTLTQTVRTQTAAILNALTADGDFPKAIAQLDTLFDQVAANGNDKTLDAFRDAAFARRLVRQLAGAPADKRLELLAYLRQHDTLARTMAFMINPTRQNSGAAPYAVLLQLRDKFGDQIEKFSNLTTAICVVHDRPFERHINEVTTNPPTPTELFEYYSANEKYMLFGIKNVPPELLIYVVDTTASIDEMTWAMKKYAGDKAIGQHFFDINYDYDSLKDKPKKISAVAYTLPNILKYGGICADQAFFATELGKSIGVPTAYTHANSAEVGHAWVGYLQERNGEGAWNFDEGRYSAYRGIRGEVMDPQMRQEIPDAFVSLLAELIGTRTHKLSPEERHNAVALTDAAIRVSELAGPFNPPALDPKPADARPTARTAGIDGSLELLKSAVTQNRGYPRPWYVVWTMAKDGKLSMPQKKEWRDASLNLCGAKYPDFAVATLEPIIASVEDPAMQNQWWDACFNVFQNRADLAASIRMHQAKLWEDQKQPAKAGACYEDVINRYTNAGPFVLDALAGTEKLLEGKPDKIARLYEQTFAKAQKPRELGADFVRQSNWYNIGIAYASKLREAGQPQKADAVITQLSQ